MIATLPKELLEACGFGAEVTVTAQNCTLLVSPGPEKARQGWAEALRAIPLAELDRDFEELQCCHTAASTARTPATNAATRAGSG